MRFVYFRVDIHTRISFSSRARIGRDNQFISPSYHLKHPHIHQTNLTLYITPIFPSSLSTTTTSLRQFGIHENSLLTVLKTLLQLFVHLISSLPPSCNVNYISFLPYLLFKTVSDGFRCSKMLRRYVWIIQRCSDYVLYIIL